MTHERNHRSPLARFLFESDYTAKQISDETGVDEATISRFANGKSGISAENLLRLSKFTGLAPWVLMDDPELAPEPV